MLLGTSKAMSALDRWIAGQLTGRQFLEETDWYF